MFLLGLQQLGKGDWRGIARNYVVSRTPTQVASHAQKYFIRQTNSSRRKRRSSLFDMSAVHRDFLSFDHQHEELQGSSQLPTPQNDNHNLLTAPALDEECESMDSTKSNDLDALPPKPDISQLSYYPIVYPAYISPFYPFAVPFWSGSDNSEEVETKKETHEILKPTAVHSKSPINVDELVGMSKLSLGEPIGHSAPSSLSLKLLEGSSRQSAFHANPGSGSSSMNTSSSPIHAV